MGTNAWRLIACLTSVLLFCLFVFNSLPDKLGLETNHLQKARKSSVLLMTAVFSTNETYLRFFLESAVKSGCDVILIGDVPPSYVMPGLNVQHFQISWADFLENANQKVFDGKHVLSSTQAASPYKVVEFKPMLAHLFPQMVEGYEWWGHVDNDMVLGTDIPIQLDGYLQTMDIISISGERASVGPLQLYRNTETINTLFQRGFVNSSITLEDILRYPTYVGFDEWGQNNPWPGQETPSMSSIIVDVKDELGLRVQMGGLPDFVYDGFCHIPDIVQNKWSTFDQRYPSDGECAECLFGDGQLYVVSENSDKQPVLGCHYQFSKNALRKSLESPELVTAMLEQKSFRVSYTSGFRPS